MSKEEDRAKYDKYLAEGYKASEALHKIEAEKVAEQKQLKADKARAKEELKAAKAAEKQAKIDAKAAKAEEKSISTKEKKVSKKIKTDMSNLFDYAKHRATRKKRKEARHKWRTE